MKSIPLTDKSVRAIISALRSAANIRQTKKDRDYMLFVAQRMISYQQMCLIDREYSQRLKREKLRKTAKKGISK